MQPTFDEIVRAWTLHYDDRLPTDRKERREAFVNLLGNLKEHGFGRTELNTSKKERIIKFCVNPNHKNKSKLKKWVSILVNDLEAAILLYYPVIEIKTHFVTNDISSKLSELERKAEESKKLTNSSDKDDEDDSEEGFSIEDNTPLDIKGAIENPVKPRQNEFDITDEMLDQMDGPEPVYDPDFMKKLGLE
jgi:hypothetical protein